MDHSLENVASRCNTPSRMTEEASLVINLLAGIVITLSATLAITLGELHRARQEAQFNAECIRVIQKSVRQN